MISKIMENLLFYQKNFKQEGMSQIIYKFISLNIIYNTAGQKKKRNTVSQSRKTFYHKN